MIKSLMLLTIIIAASANLATVKDVLKSGMAKKPKMVSDKILKGDGTLIFDQTDVLGLFILDPN